MALNVEFVEGREELEDINCIVGIYRTVHNDNLANS